MLFANGDKVLFTGDSVTDAGRGRPVGEGLHAGVGTGYVRIVETLLNVYYPERLIQVSNTGNSGDNVVSLKARWQNDVMNLHPDWVSVCIGVNDVWRQFDSPSIKSQHVYIDEYRKTLSELVERTLPSVKGMILLSPYYMESNREDAMRAKMDEYVAAVAEIASKYNTHYVDLQAAFDKYLTYRHSSFIAWDRVHPNQVGCMIIAREIMRSVGFDREFL